ncbi:hypothetical protein [Leptothrix discophora]|uniref:Uncharacterized protein n=1 Tax=Leptothrix discophora TaxID=89 RepID=A0ABT9G3M4_LEPDI|nr:hypothetical protein [Leptothrix discophora]MDP4301094.1 hypothetical protein [Leptothrix discophora]
MVLLDNLPTDSVLRRHATTERLRSLGLPPSDAVLRRHHDQHVAALQVRAAAADAARRAAAPLPRSAPARSPAPPAAARPAPVAAPAAGSSGDGLFGWLRRLLGRH